LKNTIIFLFVWLLYVALTLPLTLLGVPLVALLAALSGAQGLRESRQYGDKRAVRVWSSGFVNAIWGNDEDGIDGLPLMSVTSQIVQPRQAWWGDTTKDWSRWHRIFVWSALRNSTANLRFLPFFGLLIDPTLLKFSKKVRADGSTAWWLGWQGYHASFRWYYSKTRCFWIGWKILPADLKITGHFLPDSDGRSTGVGFAFQPFAGIGAQDNAA
jgi:hypothetical protein